MKSHDAHYTYPPSYTLRNLSAFVVSPEQRYFVGPSGFEQEQSGERLETVITAIHKVSHEDIVGVWRWAAGSDQERDMLTTNIININIIKSTKIDLKSSSRS